MTTPGRIYCGKVHHKRLRPKQHALSYGVFSLLVDVDQLNTLDRQLRLFGYNRFRVFSIHDADFGRRDGKPLAEHARSTLREAGFDAADWRIELLAYPRVLGYVFNPLSV